MARYAWPLWVYAAVVGWAWGWAMPIQPQSAVLTVVTVAATSPPLLWLAGRVEQQATPARRSPRQPASAGWRLSGQAGGPGTGWAATRKG